MLDESFRYVVVSKRVRHVRTPEGSRFFRLPIGAPITADVLNRAKREYGHVNTSRMMRFDSGQAPDLGLVHNEAMPLTDRASQEVANLGLPNASGELESPQVVRSMRAVRSGEVSPQTVLENRLYSRRYQRTNDPFRRSNSKPALTDAEIAAMDDRDRAEASELYATGKKTRRRRRKTS